jgi:ABC-type uncharacterized transport system permease subunit
MIQLLGTVFSAVFFTTVIRTSTPLILAALGGLVSDLAGSLNIALEGIMLMSALTAVVVSVAAPWWVAVLSSLCVGGLLGGLMAFFHLRLKANMVVVGFAINILAEGSTVYALSLATGGDKGTSINLASKSIPSVDFPFLKAIPVVGDLAAKLLSSQSLLTWLAFGLVGAIWYFLYRTPEGSRFRAVGEYPAAPEAAGISVDRMRTIGLVASGALAALGGTQLAMYNYIGFTRNMTAGRGFIALGAVLLGARHPVGTVLAALLFGAFDALSVVLPSLFDWMPGELIHTTPFVVTVFALILFSYRGRPRATPARPAA